MFGGIVLPQKFISILLLRSFFSQPTRKRQNFDIFWSKNAINFFFEFAEDWHFPEMRQTAATLFM
jgi:hypothetical protein